MRTWVYICRTLVKFGHKQHTTVPPEPPRAEIANLCQPTSLARTVILKFSERLGKEDKGRLCKTPEVNSGFPSCVHIYDWQSHKHTQKHIYTYHTHAHTKILIYPSHTCTHKHAHMHTQIYIYILMMWKVRLTNLHGQNSESLHKHSFRSVWPSCFLS